MDNRGAIAPGYVADLTVLEDLQTFHVLEVYKNGVRVWAENKQTEITVPCMDEALKTAAENTFHLPKLSPEDFIAGDAGVIGMLPGEIVTEYKGIAQKVDLDTDILKIAVVERHKNTGHIGLGYLQGYGLRKGAVATSVSHDSHNIIAVGENDEDLALAVNRVAENKGGIVVVCGGKIEGELSLEIGGLMSGRPLLEVNEKLENAKKAAYRLGVKDTRSRVMTLSFMALPVIPQVRITTRGIVDVIEQRYL